jgi:hypothetical protein
MNNTLLLLEIDAGDFSVLNHQSFEAVSTGCCRTYLITFFTPHFPAYLVLNNLERRGHFVI